MAVFSLVTLGLLLLLTPTLAELAGHPLGFVTSATLMGLGVLTSALGSILFAYSKLYRRTKASEAFVRTGLGGVQVIRDGGSFVVPFVHELVRVSLKTLKLQVTRENEDALITQDKLRADIHAEFFVRVQPDRDSILQAARSLGDLMDDPASVRALVEDKLVSALRTAAASKTLEQLNSERDEFLMEVMKLVRDDLNSNGLVLETVTISRLDQTDDRFLKAENIFDAQGRRKIAEITQQNLTERNRLVRDGERARKEQDVLTRNKVLELEKLEREAAAKQQAEIAKVEAETSREANEKSIDARRKVELAEIEKRKALELAMRLEQQAVEVLEREKQEAIAAAEQKRAVAERDLAEAMADREAARQRVLTVEATEAAERAKRQKVIEAQAQAEKAYVEQQRRADVEAYTLRTQADAQRAAAEAEAAAIRTRAEARADAERQEAEGAKAKAMVPVEVKRAEVAIERDRIDTVVKPELEARERHGQVAQDFEIRKLAVQADKEVQVAFAEATAKLFQKMEAQLFGTPEDVTRILDSVVRGRSVASAIEGFLGAAGEPTRQMLGGLVSGVGKVAEAVAQRVTEAPAELPEGGDPSGGDPEELDVDAA